eukprot:CAMPEP_0185252058 /NCGR_PEP_ID=MMETSP1359-20130426/1287_1 /TAXON_ID=552665 /ORGANISM="Bigelowiella longifila, Strain CCMP242" /LENGTH=294 /DNA_ID=CAMNT_0027834143 /DNA_START=206 /DNA_END=1090 /DNA_ORIENTATION=-
MRRNLPDGFTGSDGVVNLEVLALRRNASDNFDPNGDDDHTEIPYTVHEYSCPNTMRSFTVDPPAWRRVQLCGGNPDDCRQLSFNASEGAIFLIRGFGDGASSNQRTYSGRRVINVYPPAMDTGIDAQIGQIASIFEVEDRSESFVFQIGMERYNTHIGNGTSFSPCGPGLNGLFPPYLRLTGSQTTTFIREFRPDFADTFGTIVGFASGVAAIGIPLAIILRGAICEKCRYWPSRLSAKRESGSECKKGLTSKEDNEAVVLGNVNNLNVKENDRVTTQSSYQTGITTTGEPLDK